MREDFEAFWREAQWAGAPFVHPQDLPVLEKWPSHLSGDFDTFIRGPLFGDKEDGNLHLGLYPCPVLGNLATARVFILLLNPGLGYTDYLAESFHPGFTARALRVARQDLEGEAFPFYFLDPSLCWHGGFQWWERKLGPLASALQPHTGGYLDALRFMANTLASLELVPYHSRIFKAHNLVKSLPSAQAARDYVRSELLPRALDGEVTLIATRQVDGWGLTAPSSGRFIRYEGGERRGASLSPNTSGGAAILAQLMAELGVSHNAS